MVAQTDPTTIVTEVEGAIGWIRLNRPDRRNAISFAMRAELAEALRSFDSDPSIRLVVLTGQGSAFCAGVDLSEGSSAGPLETKPVASPLESFGKPLVAAVNGAAVGGGLELVLACDVRVASTTAKFGLPEVRIGSLPGSGGTQRLARATSPALAARMLLTGEPIDADEALRFGLVSDLAEPEELQAVTARIASTIAQNAPLSLRAARTALRIALEPPASALGAERALWSFLSGTDDRAEGRAAFRERRPPRFEGR